MLYYSDNLSNGIFVDIVVKFNNLALDGANIFNHHQQPPR